MKSITEGSRAVFTFKFPAEVEGNGYATTAQGWVDMGVETSLNNFLGLEAITNLEGHHIIIGKSSLNGYYDITFTMLYDLDGETPLQFKGVDDIHFKDVLQLIDTPKTNTMRTLYVKKTNYAELKNKWGIEPIFAKHDTLYIRCNKDCKVDWDNAPVYKAEDLVGRNNVQVLTL